MTREEAVQYFARQRDTLIWGLEDSRIETRQAHDAYNVAIDALISPRWVKTSDRLPENGDDWVVGLFLLDDGRTIPDTVPSGTVKRQIKMCPYWMPLPKLPEVEG